MCCIDKHRQCLLDHFQLRWVSSLPQRQFGHGHNEWLMLLADQPPSVTLLSPYPLKVVPKQLDRCASQVVVAGSVSQEG